MSRATPATEPPRHRRKHQEPGERPLAPAAVGRGFRGPRQARVDDPELAEAGDPLFRDVAKLSGNDREIAKDFLKMLAERSKKDKGSPA